MAERNRRSRNGELRRGATDGAYKQTNIDWSNNVSGAQRQEIGFVTDSMLHGAFTDAGDGRPFFTDVPKGTA